MKKFFITLLMIGIIYGRTRRIVGGVYPEPRVKGYISSSGNSYGSLILGFRVPIPSIRSMELRFNIVELAIGNQSWVSLNMLNKGNFVDLLYYFSRSRNLGLYGIGSFGFLFTNNNTTFSLLFGIGAETFVSSSANLTWELGLSLDSNSYDDSGAFVGIGIKFR